MVFIFHLFVTLFCQEFSGTPAALHWLADLAADVALTVNLFFLFFFYPLSCRLIHDMIPWWFRIFLVRLSMANMEWRSIFFKSLVFLSLFWQYSAVCANYFLLHRVVFGCCLISVHMCVCGCVFTLFTSNCN